MMTKEQHTQEVDDDTRFDLLVDGELSEHDRRALLAGLDEEPGGWRRCALAFLEAQSWRREMPGAMREPTADRAASESPPVRAASPSERAHKWVARMALAASFLLAFSVGLMLRGVWNRPANDPGASNQVATENPSSGGNELAMPNEIAVADDGQTPRQSSGVAPELLQAVDTQSGRHTVMHSGRIPEEVVDALRRMGYEVEHSQEVWSIDSGDGSRGYVPVDKTDIRYVGDWYQ